MGGMPTIRGLRIPVATVVSMVADGMTAAEIVDDLPDLVVEDVAEALRYAAEAVRERDSVQRMKLLLDQNLQARADAH